jgi:phage baseplate assembly protein W
VPNKSFLGQDFHLGFVADEEGRVLARPYSRVDLQAESREDVAPRRRDLSVVSGRANLVQSLIMRLKTERGELASLGHPDYGSQHHRLIGEPNTANNRSLLKLYVLQCLRQERRIEQTVQVEVKPAEGPENRDKVDIAIIVKIKGEPDPLNLVVPFSFEEPLE